MSGVFELPALEPRAVPAPPPLPVDEAVRREQEHQSSREQGYLDGKAEAKAEV